MELLVVVLVVIVLVMAILLYVQQRNLKKLRKIIGETVASVDLINSTLATHNDALSSSHNALQIINARLVAKEHLVQQER